MKCGIQIMSCECVNLCTFVCAITSNLHLSAFYQIDKLIFSFNFVAHELAHYARRTGSSQLWMGVTPPFLSLLIHLDAC